MNWQGLDASILGPAFVAGLAVLATHVPLGHEVLRRGIIFLDLAVAQIAALGVMAAGIFFGEAQGPVQLSALGAALAGAALLGWCERRWPEIQEAIIGSAFVIAASTALLIMARDPHGGEHLEDLLAGQILWVTWQQVGVAVAVAVLVTGLWLGIPAWRARLFYALFAVAITTSVQLVGIYLVFASLILPALAAQFLRHDTTAGAFLAAVIAYALGLALSGLFDLPAGPLIVLCLAFPAVAAATARAVLRT